MKKFLVRNFFAASILIMFAALGFLLLDKQDTIEKWTVKAEIAVQHAKLHIFNIPHAEITMEAQEAEVDIGSREIRLYKIKGMPEIKGSIKKLDKMSVEILKDGSQLMVVFPADEIFIIIINDREFYFPEKRPKSKI